MPESLKNAVLVVDDDVLVRVMAAAIVEDAGYPAVEASDASEALAILNTRSAEFCAVVTDVRMPGVMDGRAPAYVIRDRWPDIAVVITSGYYGISEGVLPSGAIFMA